jgi:WD40 repeat protein
MDQHTGVSSLALSSDENLFLISYNDGEMHLFSFEKYPRVILVRKFREYSGKVLAIFSPSNYFILSTERYSGNNELLASSIKLWDTKSGDEVRTFTGHRSAVNSIAFNSSGSMIVSGSRDRSIKLWAADTGQVIRTYTGHSKGVSSVAFSPDGKHIASSSEDGTIKIWELDTQTIEKK